MLSDFLYVVSSDQIQVLVHRKHLRAKIASQSVFLHFKNRLHAIVVNRATFLLS